MGKLQKTLAGALLLCAFALAACQRRAPPPAATSVATTANPMGSAAVADAAASSAQKPKPIDPSQPLRPGYLRPLLVDYHAHLSLEGIDRIAQIMTENGIELMVNLSGGSYRRGPQ